MGGKDYTVTSATSAFDGGNPNLACFTTWSGADTSTSMTSYNNATDTLKLTITVEYEDNGVAEFTVNG